MTVTVRVPKDTPTDEESQAQIRRGDDVDRVQVGRSVEVRTGTRPEIIERGFSGPRGLPGEAGTEYVVDSVVEADEQGPLAIAVVNEAGADLAGADERHAPHAVTKKGDLYIAQRGPLAVVDSALAGFVDGLEALLTSISGFVDGLEAAFTTLNGKDFATQATLAAVETRANLLASETKLEAVRALVATRASEATLASRASEATLAALAVVVGTLGTQETLELVHTRLQEIEGNTDGVEAKLDLLATYLNGVEPTLADIVNALDMLQALDVDLSTRASEATVADHRDITASKFDPVTPTPATVTLTGPTDIVDPGADALQVRYLYAQADPSLSGSVEVEFLLGATSLYVFTLEASQPWARSPVINGDPGEALRVGLSSPTTVRVNVETRTI